jgi:signal transduction histidine kinase
MGSRSSGELDAVADRVTTLVQEKLRMAVHEIRQPLAAVLALAEAARTTPGVPADARERLEELIDQAQEVSAAAWSVLGPRASAEGSVDLDLLLDSVCRAFGVTWGGDLVRRGGAGPVTGVSRTMLRRCLVNVLDNAVRAAGPGGRVVVTARRGADRVQIVVEDDGPGLGRIPRGAGLGLTATREALESVGGALSMHGAPSGGSRPRTRGVRVVLSLPVSAADPDYGDQPVRAG